MGSERISFDDAVLEVHGVSVVRPVIDDAIASVIASTWQARFMLVAIAG
jgi:hypothetical protein